MDTLSLIYHKTIIHNRTLIYTLPKLICTCCVTVNIPYHRHLVVFVVVVVVVVAVVVAAAVVVAVELVLSVAVVQLVQGARINECLNRLPTTVTDGEGLAAHVHF